MATKPPFSVGPDNVQLPFHSDAESEHAGAAPTAVPVEQEAGPPPSPFDDLDALRMDQNFEELSGVERLITTVPVGKPTKREFVRVHPGENYRMNCGIIELQEEGGDFISYPPR